MANTKKLGKLSINADQYNEATTAAGVSPQQAEQLWTELEKRARTVDMAMFGYILGGIALIAGAAIGVGAFIDDLGPMGAAVVAFVASAVSWFIGDFFDKGKDQRIPAGVFYLISALTIWPAVYFTMDKASGASHFATEPAGMLIQMLAIMGVSFFHAYRSGIAFATVPALLAGAGATFAVVDMATGTHVGFFSSLNYHAMGLIGYGLVVNNISFKLDGKTDDDFSFWGYFVGVAAFWLGMTMVDKGPGIWALTGALGVISLATSVWFSRRIFAIAGGAAVLSYIAYLAFNAFSHSAGGLAVSLLVVGGLAFWATMAYRRNRASVDAWVRSLVPEAFQKH
jgi:hypothetical protein